MDAADGIVQALPMDIWRCVVESVVSDPEPLYTHTARMQTMRTLSLLAPGIRDEVRRFGWKALVATAAPCTPTSNRHPLVVVGNRCDTLARLAVASDADIAAAAETLKVRSWRDLRCRVGAGNGHRVRAAVVADLMAMASTQHAYWMVRMNLVVSKARGVIVTVPEAQKRYLLRPQDVLDRRPPLPCDTPNTYGMCLEDAKTACLRRFGSTRAFEAAKAAAAQRSEVRADRKGRAARVFDAWIDPIKGALRPLCAHIQCTSNPVEQGRATTGSDLSAWLTDAAHASLAHALGAAGGTKRSYKLFMADGDAARLSDVEKGLREHLASMGARAAAVTTLLPSLAIAGGWPCPTDVAQHALSYVGTGTLGALTACKVAVQRWEAFETAWPAGTDDVLKQATTRARMREGLDYIQYMTTTTTSTTTMTGDHNSDEETLACARRSFYTAEDVFAHPDIAPTLALDSVQQQQQQQQQHSTHLCATHMIAALSASFKTQFKCRREWDGVAAPSVEGIVDAVRSQAAHSVAQHCVAKINPGYGRNANLEAFTANVRDGWSTLVAVEPCAMWHLLLSMAKDHGIVNHIGKANLCMHETCPHIASSRCTIIMCRGCCARQTQAGACNFHRHRL
jgi:hypothetical protein